MSFTHRLCCKLHLHRRIVVPTTKLSFLYSSDYLVLYGLPNLLVKEFLINSSFRPCDKDNM